MVHSQRLRAFSAAPAAARHSASLRKKTKAPYKIVLEQVTEKRRKLLTVLSFNANAPPGYTFIPAGDPQITNRCKQVAREDGRKVFIVSTSKHKHKGILSHEVHRIGHHFPSIVVEKACTSLGVSLTQHGHVLPSQKYRQTTRRNTGPRYNTTTDPVNQNSSLQEDVSQAILDMQAREAIKDLFPKIPEKDLHDIICRAFKKGKDRVGTVLELPLSRRVQLAVVAHIRHVYTDYDKLLKTGTYQKARATVEKPCLDLLARWRSDDDDDPNAMEEILREVIVIDDDDDEVNDRKSSLGNRDSINRESSIEIISSHALPDEVQVHQIDYGGPAQLIHGGQPYSPDFMDSEIVRHSDLEQLPNFHHTRSNLSSLDRNGVHRHRWREALDRHRTNLVPIHPGKHELLAQKSAVYPRVSMYHTEAESRQLRVVDQSRELLPPDTVKPQFPGHLGPKGKENIPQRRSDFADRRLRPEPPRLREVILPTEVYLQNSRESLTEPMSFQRIRTIDNDHNHGYLGQPRINTSEERITRVRDKISERDVIDSTHNYQPRHVIHQTPGQILRSVESNTLQTNDGKDPFNIPHNRSSNYLDESFRFDRGVDFEPRGIHVNDETEAYHSKRRRVEELAPIASDVLRQHDSRSHSDRNVLVPLGRGNNWAESHEQLSPVAPSSVMNPFIRQNSNVYDQPVQATRYVDRETIPRAVPYKASSPSRGPMRAFDSDETLHPSSHSLRNLPIGSRQPGHDFLYPTFEALGKASLVPSFRDEHIRLQSSHEPFTLSNSSRDAYVHPPRNLPNRRFIDPIEYRPAGRQQYEQDLRSDFARLDTGSRYVSENSKPSNDGLETHRGTLLTAYRDRSPEIRGEAPTCIFLRKLPDENYALPQKAKSSSSTTRLIYHANSSPRGDFDEFLPTGAGSRVLQARTPVQENIQVNSWQDNSRLANDQRAYYPRIKEIPRGKNVAHVPAQNGELGGTTDRPSPRYVDVHRWERTEPREIIVID